MVKKKRRTATLKKTSVSAGVANVANTSLKSGRGSQKRKRKASASKNAKEDKSDPALSTTSGNISSKKTEKKMRVANEKAAVTKDRNLDSSEDEPRGELVPTVVLECDDNVDNASNGESTGAAGDEDGTIGCSDSDDAGGEESNCDENREAAKEISQFNHETAGKVVVERSKDSESLVMKLLFERDEKLVFHGCVRLVVISGAVCVWGHVLTPQSGEQELFSPQWNPSGLLSICPARFDQEGNILENVRALVSLRTCEREQRDIRNSIEPTDDEWTLTMGQIQGFHPIATCNQGGSSWAPLQLSPVLEQTAHKLSHPSAWKIADKLSVVVCGGRNTGKSTAIRYLVNSLLNRYPHVAILDADLGQSELGPPGFVDVHIVHAPLFGPPHTHLQHPVFAQFVGSTNSSANPTQY